MLERVYMLCGGSVDGARSAKDECGSNEMLLVGAKGLDSDTVSLMAPLSNLYLFRMSSESVEASAR